MPTSSRRTGDEQDSVSPIRENPSQKRELLAGHVGRFVAEHPRLALLFTYLVGASGRSTRKLLRDPGFMGRLERSLPALEERVELPDRFNALFLERGWVAFEDLDEEVCREAVLLAEGGDMDGAEAVLVRHFDAEIIAGEVERLARDLEPFGKRRELLLKAVDDHRQERYHASVPVALFMADGVTKDLTGKLFFARGEASHLKIPDSIAGHSSGLKALSAVMSKRRTRTSTAELSIPYRHGIMHGRDLGYANEPVSAKSFATLLAVGSWALSLHRGGQPLEPYLPQLDLENVSARDVGRAAKEAGKALLRAWSSQSNT